MMNGSSSPVLFESSSNDCGQVLHVSFADDPTASLGVQLINCSNNESFQFLPGYAIVGRLLPGETVARKTGVKVGDCIVAINGHGFRRFAYTDDLETINDVVFDLDHAVIPEENAYQAMMQKLQAVKAAQGDPPLVITLERYGWDARANAWGRFLAARDGKVPEALQLYQNHLNWRETTFPIHLNTPGLQTILRKKAVSEIDIPSPDANPTVYVNYGTLNALQSSGTVTTQDVVQAFTICTERMLAENENPKAPRTVQFIDLSGVSMTSFRVDTLKQIYYTFEPNYPETLARMVIYPVSNLYSATARTLLSFVHARTQAKFLITNSLPTICQELGWDLAEVEACGGVTEFVHRHEKADDLLHE